MILPPLAPALLLLGQAGHGGELQSDGPGRAAPPLQRLYQAPASDLPAVALEPPAPVAAAPVAARPAEPPVVVSPSPEPAAKRAIADGQPVLRVRHHHAPGDPLEGFNRKMFAVQDGLDRALIRRQ